MRSKRVRRSGRLMVLALVLAAAAAACTDDPEGSPQAGTPAERPRPEPTFCPLSGARPPSGVELGRPAVAVKVENAEVAFPLSGLEKAEVVFEEVVEGGITRFMALYHCTDATQVGPVRSIRTVDPAIMKPVTRILAASGGNDSVTKVLQEQNIILIEENLAGNAMKRVPRPGLALEHTLYGNTSKLRKLGAKRFNNPPPESMIRFGDIESRARKTRRVTIVFSPAVTVQYTWKHRKWLRFQDGEPFEDAKGRQIAVDNVVIEEHTVESAGGVDVAGNTTYKIADVSGSGRAVLLRDGKAIVGRWKRKNVDSPVLFVGKNGMRLAFAEGTTWVHLVPDDKGDVKGSFKIGK